MKKAVFVVLPVLLALACIDAQAQRVRYPFPPISPTPTPTPRPSPSPTPDRVQPCPRITVQPQSARTIRDGQPVSFGANIAGGDSKVMPTLLWNVNAGYIRDGQGSRQIQVDSTGAGTASDRELKAELWVGGFAPECSSLQASATVKIIPPAMKFGEFGELPPKSVSENLGALATFLTQSQDNLYLIAYSGRKSERGFAFNSIRKMKEELIAAGISPRRIVAVDGGFMEEPLFDFWIVPQGAEPPRPTPTVNRNEIVYPKAERPRRP